MPRLVVASLLMVLAIEAHADGNSTPYYRFITKIENGLLTPSGETFDVGVEYFASPDGGVAYAGIAPFGVAPNGECVPGYNAKGEYCSCEDDGSTYCASANGPVGTLSVDLKVQPIVNEDGSIDFDVQLNQIVPTDGVQVRVNGFSEVRGVPKINAGQIK